MFARQRKVYQDRRAALLKHSKEILSKAETEDRELADEDRKQLDANESDIKGLNNDIARLERLEEIEKESAAKPVLNQNVPPGDSGNGANPAITQQQKDKEPKKIILPATARQKPQHYATGEDAYVSGMWFLASVYKSAAAMQFCMDHGIQMAASGVDGPKGGLLVPTPLENSIIDLREQYGVFRQESRPWPMASDSVVIPRRASGLTAYFIGENTEITESEKGWTGIELQARKLAAATRYPTELAEDAIIMIADDLANEMGYAFALKEDQSGFLGDGTSTYGGITGAVTKINDGNHAGGIAEALAGNTAFATLDMVDFEACIGKLPQYAENNAKWYISKAGYAASMLRLLDAAGGNTMSQLAQGGGKTFLGYPVVISQVMNGTLTAQTSTVVALFGDLRMASTFGTRRGVTLKSSEHRYMEQDQILLTGTERFALNVHELGDATTAGPLIALKTPSG